LPVAARVPEGTCDPVAFDTKIAGTAVPSRDDKDVCFLTRATRALLTLAVAAVLVAGCSQAGTPQVSTKEAAKIGVATSRMTVACGRTGELRAFGGARPRGLAAQESIAVSGARKLAAVYAHDQTHIYQGESVGGLVHESLSLLDNCGLSRAGKLLLAVLERGRS
jgi:hypothetical protein